ncbi:MAG: bifunctional 4-hydroxy-2-oxoglutarate aldolase/2-dehydro-3-deoxy-phosphogluconate aldolase [Gemmobacter sp.]
MTPGDASARMRAICAMAPVVPVLVVEDADRAEALARALVAGGLPVLEVTLRTRAALTAIRRMAAVPGAMVGAGTLLSPADARAAVDAGARFGVSPGATDRLLDACETEALPLLPGAATASEAMRLLERGYDAQKFFPAEPAGGARMLAALAGPLPQVAFCPTGGIGPDNAGAYLRLPSVMCVGGSWVAPAAAVAAGDWDRIERLARDAAAMARVSRR